MSNDVIELGSAECLHLLRQTNVGRIGIVTDHGPQVLPLNFRLVESPEVPWIVVRTRPGGEVDCADRRVAFEVDGVDPFHRCGWSVMARGVLHDIEDESMRHLHAAIDPDPWPDMHRTRWLGIRCDSITGRRLGSTEMRWTLQFFHRHGP